MDISNDIISGLKYLHENKVAIVMSNPQISYFQTHYTSTETEEFQIKKIICKITDFGEARLPFIQAHTRLTTSPSDINKGNNF